MIDRSELLKACQKQMQRLKHVGAAIDCYSVRGDGKATEGCDFAIDAYNVPDDFLGASQRQRDPYAKGDKSLTRLMFNV